MENNLQNNVEQKTPNYLKRISTLEKEVKFLKQDLDGLKIKMDNILKALKRR